MATTAAVGLGSALVFAVALLIGAIAGMSSSGSPSLDIDILDRLPEINETPSLPSNNGILENSTKPGITKPSYSISGADCTLHYNELGIVTVWEMSNGETYFTEYSIAIENYPERLRIDCENQRYYIDVYKDDTYTGWQDVFDFNGDIIGSVSLPTSNTSINTNVKDETQTGTQVGTVTETKPNDPPPKDGQTVTPKSNFNFGLFIPIIIIAFIAVIVAFSKRNVVTKNRKKLQKLKKH